MPLTAGGALLETFANKVARQLSDCDLPVQRHYYRDRSSREIDLVIERANGTG